MNDFTASPFERAVGKVYQLYQEKLDALQRAGLRRPDYEDGAASARESEKAREHYQNRFQYVHCDEFQDVNDSQYRLLTLFAGKQRNICVVGDDDQSIYAFRGANVQIILNFERDFPDATIIKLEQNYRSTKTILDAAYHVVQNNRGRADKRLWTDNIEGESITLVEAPNEVEEAVAVVNVIRDGTITGDRHYSDLPCSTAPTRSPARWKSSSSTTASRIRSSAACGSTSGVRSRTCWPTCASCMNPYDGL